LNARSLGEIKENQRRAGLVKPAIKASLKKKKVRISEVEIESFAGQEPGPGIA